MTAAWTLDFIFEALAAISLTFLMSRAIAANEALSTWSTLHVHGLSQADGLRLVDILLSAELEDRHRTDYANIFL